jgi:acyl-CoA synthetase (AMP-forming)/AMP-acid ligase II
MKLALQLFKNSIDTQRKLRLNLHSLSVSELLEHGRRLVYPCNARRFDFSKGRGRPLALNVLTRNIQWNNDVYSNVNILSFLVREKIGPIATPDVVQYAPGLPKTRSGKIMRRVLRELAQGNSSFGDQTTLADPSVVDTLLKLRPQNIPGM